jgi:hypothetical protein
MAIPTRTKRIIHTQIRCPGFAFGFGSGGGAEGWSVRGALGVASGILVPHGFTLTMRGNIKLYPRNLVRSINPLRPGVNWGFAFLVSSPPF